MAAGMERLRDRWERITPRERGLVLVLGVTAVAILLSWVAFTIRDGIAGKENANKERRRALAALADYRASEAARAGSGPKVAIPKQPIGLEEYLDNIANDVGIKIPAFKKRSDVGKGRYTEKSTRVEVRGVSIAEFAELLEKIESESKLVVITELHVKRHFRNHEKLDVVMVVATYFVTPPKEEGGESNGDSKEG